MTTFLDMDVTELPSTHKLCYLGDCNFTRSSVAYDYLGREVPANQPRFTHRVPDVTVTNLLTGNQSDGGDTNNPELLTLNQRTGTDALGNTSGTTPSGIYPVIFMTQTAENRNLHGMYRSASSTNWRFKQADNVGNITYTDITQALTQNIWYKFSAKTDTASSKTTIVGSGVSNSGTQNTPYLGTEKATELYIGSDYSGTNRNLNGLIRNFTVSNTKRDDSDITTRAAANSDDLGFPVDENCTLVFPLKKDLSAYRVVMR